MKQNKYSILDKEPWYKNHPSPMAKWLHNLALLGACWFKNEKLALVWFIFFNPAIVILYVTIAVIYLFFLISK